VANAMGVPHRGHHRRHHHRPHHYS
jgi:hypothetical protein